MSAPTRVSGYGVAVTLPPGWDARIYRRPPLYARAAGGPTVATTHAILHAGNFPLPEGRGDFGSGAVERMGPSNLLLVLFEYHPDAAGRALFAHPRPARLLPADFAPAQLQRRLPGQSGVQKFFHDGGRAFCLYVVLGSYARRGALVPQANEVLDAIAIQPVGAP